MTRTRTFIKLFACAQEKRGSFAIHENLKITLHSLTLSTKSSLVMIAIIPARGGSKRIPRKNIREFHGKPILAYTIKCAQDSGLFERIIVSTEDEQIAEIAKSYGAEVPFIRPTKLADDFTTTREVVCHAIEALGTQKNVVCLSAVAPLLKPETIKKACSMLNEEDLVFDCLKLEACTSVVRTFIINNSKSRMILPQYVNTRTQDCPPVYYHTGQFLIGTAKVWLKKNDIYLEGTPYVLDPNEAVDIDYEGDWKEAESLYMKAELDKQTHPKVSTQ